MKKYTITEEQIKSISQGGGKTKIKEMFPQVFETKLKIGKWYKHKHYKDCLINYKGDISYGFGTLGWWTNAFISCSDLDEYIAATNEEVKTALIAEAKKRGYTEFNFESLNEVCRGFDKNFDNWTYNANNLYTKGFGEGGKLIFKNGKWADIKI